MKKRTKERVIEELDKLPWDDVCKLSNKNLEETRKEVEKFVFDYVNKKVYNYNTYIGSFPDFCAFGSAPTYIIDHLDCIVTYTSRYGFLIELIFYKTFDDLLENLKGGINSP